MAEAVEARTESVTIEAIGHRGDGIARTERGVLHVPFTLPGERVAVALPSGAKEDEGRARLVAIEMASPERVAPICRHFGTCGSCALQMMPLDATRALKRGFVVAALERQGLSAPVDAPRGAPVAGRRRATMTALRDGKRLVLGYHARRSEQIIDIEECPVLVPALQKRLGAMRALVAPFVTGRKPVRVIATMSEAGLDLALEGTRAPDAATIAAAVAAGAAAGLARLSIGGEPVLTPAEPVLRVSGVSVVPPPGAFLQASAEAEAIMAGLVTEHLSGAKRAADLFAGLGTFSFALARTMRVTAYEASAPMLAALLKGARTPGLKSITAERRDLFAFPLSPKELAGFDAAVVDPPWSGAKAQAEALAASKLARIAFVSCNPASFARDARILVEGGYTTGARRAGRPVRLFGGDGGGGAFRATVRGRWRPI